MRLRLAAYTVANVVSIDMCQSVALVANLFRKYFIEALCWLSCYQHTTSQTAFCYMKANDTPNPIN